MEKCFVCGENIDKGACNETFSVFTINEDKDGKFKRTRKYLCGLHTTLINAQLTTMRIKRED